jgi:hypothetical protein
MFTAIIEYANDTRWANEVRTGVNLFLHVMLVWETRSTTAVLALFHDFLQGILAHGAATSGDEITRLLNCFCDLLPPPGATITTAFGPGDIMQALSKGYYVPDMPVWLGNMLVLAGQLLGLSVAGASGFKFFPSWLLEYCEKARVPVGDVAAQVYAAVEDLVQRARDAVELRSISALFSGKVRE